MWLCSYSSPIYLACGRYIAESIDKRGVASADALYFGAGKHYARRESLYDFVVERCAAVLLYLCLFVPLYKKIKEIIDNEGHGNYGCRAQPQKAHGIGLAYADIGNCL